MPEVVLSVPLLNQTQSLWCWAAVTAAVSEYFKAHLPICTPCQVAGTVLQNANCCQSPPACNVIADLDSAFRAIGLRNALANDPPLGFEEIANQVVVRQFPVGARLVHKQSAAGHFVLIVGCDADTRGVVVADPNGPIGFPAQRYRMPYETLMENYGDWGRCTHTIVVG